VAQVATELGLPGQQVKKVNVRSDMDFIIQDHKSVKNTPNLHLTHSGKHLASFFAS
jgi:tRNA pseudouridine-54 N-methylase